MVEMRVLVKAKERLIFKAPIISVSCRRAEYHFRVKPVHITFSFDLLNEYIIRTKMGKYKNK
jgi:hypothetical protein